MRKIKRKIKRTRRKVKGRPEIFYGLVGYFVGIFFINFASKGVDEGIQLSPFQAIELLNVQISTLISVPRPFSLTLGFLLTLVPLLFFYLISKKFIRKRK